MQLQLNAEDVEVLEDILSSQLSELKEQIYKADLADYKAMLRQRERVVLGLLERVRALRASTTGS